MLQTRRISTRGNEHTDPYTACGGAHIASAASPPYASSASLDANDHAPFDGGILLTTSMRATTTTVSTITVLVDPGATEYYLDNDIVSGLDTVMRDLQALFVQKQIFTAVGHLLHGTHKRLLSGFVTDEREITTS